MSEQMNHEVMNQMQARVESGLDPLTGRPLQVVGTVAWRNGVLRDDAGIEVTLSERGDWVPVEK